MYQSFYDEKRKQWQGLKTRPLYHPEVTLGEALLKSMQINGPKIAQISDDSGIRLTYNEMRERTIRAAINLQKRGYKPKQVFGIIASNSSNLAPIVFASFCMGCPINVLDTSFGKHEITHMLSITKPSLVFCDVDVYENLIDSLGEAGIKSDIITMNGKLESCRQVEDLFAETGLEKDFVPTYLDGANEIAGVFCSSGTTGLPKGVSLSHASLLTMQTNLETVQSDDILLCFSQLYWLTGVVTLLTGTLYGATRLITTQRFSTELAFRLIPQYKVSFIINAVYQLASMVRHDQIDKVDLTSLKNYCVGGSKVPVGMASEFNKHFPDGDVYDILGMTETAGIYASGPARNSDKGTVGRLSYDIVAKIIDEDGKRCGINVDGEVCLKPRYKHLGYYNNPKATEEAFDNEGFFLTGDIGHFDEDGDLFIIDRKKDMLKYCNYQVTPSEIEAILSKSKDIEGACVVGIPDLVATDLPAAAIIRKKGSAITAKEVYNIVADNMADQYKLRGGVYFVDSFPTTASGKVLRRKIKKQLTQSFNKSKLAE